MENENILTGLNVDQKKAVLQTEGPVLILAGAGSGKTKVLTHRIAYLIREKNVHPQNILAVTFTNKASEEMKKRINHLLGEKAPVNSYRQVVSLLPWMGTFHSICCKILRQEIHNIEFRRSFVIYDSDESLAAIKNAMDELNIDKKQYSPKTIKNFISGAKNELMNPKEYAKYSKGHFGEVVVRVYIQYQKELKNANALDFDDLLVKTVELFTKFPEILKRYQELFRYILIDEYQDTNTVQYRLVNLLSEKYKNICVVGDDFQAIYGFRGANFKNILDFEKDYPEAVVIKMEQNYRSTKNILEAAQSVIERNTLRSEKKLWTENEEGMPASVYEANNELDEIEFVKNEIVAFSHMNSLNDFTILYRTNAQSRIIEEFFLQNRIPYRLIGALRFYDRREIKDILAYLKVIHNESDKVSLRRIINTPTRGIGEKTAAAFDLENPKIKVFMQMMENFRNAAKEKKIDELIDEVTRESGYKNYILDGTEEGESRWENIEELKSVAQKSESLEEFLENVALVSDVDNYNKDAEAVTLMTLHNAKGLEFPIVFMVGMEEGLFPHSNCLADPNEVEEERRLCYVGMTRAQKRLYMTHARCRMIFGTTSANMPSRFLSEIPEYLIERI
ncbi:TPA: ATP-dependent DNA helicase PcrA [Candidatus Berkelbacteria bacterium]|uniref:DNA 3'-5' helicase n=1 Tax=Berkelbacteria bacterium GW2011_GWE1_39_12 TaxID=1618337 RepID=A0A0G4B277_9BACT|nr:MAG: ATP-dependent DNA helicase PcrA [Berkelbacteria bacterium GW2011_GWE1_39_12]HBO60641.1 ATP-dependent DNA helicase PcrA [Candidatus Berkelbacteria bacterium]